MVPLLHFGLEAVAILGLLYAPFAIWRTIRDNLRREGARACFQGIDLDQGWPQAMQAGWLQAAQAIVAARAQNLSQEERLVREAIGHLSREGVIR